MATIRIVKNRYNEDFMRLVDLLYLSEVELPTSFSRKKAEDIIKKIPADRIKNIVSTRFKTLRVM
jgi:sugar/nucleoside kinase (ribokinase family)